MPEIGQGAAAAGGAALRAAGVGRRYPSGGNGRGHLHFAVELSLPLGGKLSPQVTDEGATLYPAEQKKE